MNKNILRKSEWGQGLCHNTTVGTESIQTEYAPTVYIHTDTHFISITRYKYTNTTQSLPFTFMKEHSGFGLCASDWKVAGSNPGASRLMLPLGP